MEQRQCQLWIAAALFGLTAYACGHSSGSSAPRDAGTNADAGGPTTDAAGGSRDSAADTGFDSASDSAPDSPSDSAAGAPSSGIDASACAVTAPSPLLTFELSHAAFPGTGHPDVAVHIPPGFDPCTRPGMLVFFAAFDNCVSNVLGSTDSSCSPGGPARHACHLSDSLDAAHVNAILVAVQLGYDTPTGDPGALVNDAAFHDLLHELLSANLDPLLGQSLDVEGLDRVVLGSNAGGSTALAAVLTHGGVPEISEVDLFDDLLGDTTVFHGWIADNRARFAGASDGLRFLDLYTAAGGTLSNSQQLASQIALDLTDAGVESALLDDRTTAAPSASDLAHAIVFKQSALSHDAIVISELGPLASAAGFAPLP